MKAEAPELAEMLKIEQRELFLIRLLSGGYFLHDGHVRAESEHTGITLSNHWFLVVSARVETWGSLPADSVDGSREANFILRNLMEYQLSDCHGVFYVGKMVFLWNPPEKPELSVLKQQILEITELLDREYQLAVSFAISRVYDSPLRLFHAWEDTELVFEYQDVLVEDFVATAYEELTWPHMQPSPTVYLDINTRLLSAVRQADYEQIRRVFHELIDNEFAVVQPTIQIFRIRIYGVVDQLLYLMEYIRSVVGDPLVDRINPGPRLAKKQPVNQLIAEIDSILDELAAAGSQASTQSFPEWVSESRRYVEEHYTDQNLCVAMVADHVRVSPTYCSRMFKDRYGVRLFDFIQLRRLEQAKKLLKTRSSLKTIAEAVGYSSALTMSRAFKRYEGNAPNDYR